ncbi:MAG: DUF1127 domain-containing protein [Betaproteobacteria bacterium]
MSIEYAIPPSYMQRLAEFEEPARLSPRFGRRLRAIVRLVARRLRARRRLEDLDHLDERTLRDLGLTRSELASVVAELGGRAAPTRRRADLEAWTSASSRFRVRAIDSSL